MKNPGRIFQAKDYRDFLKAELDSGAYGKGANARLARHLKVQPSLVSLVLTKRQHFSTDYVPALAEFFGLTEDQAEYFLFLICRERAGSVKLAGYYDRILGRIRTKASRIAKHVKAEKPAASEEVLLQYYGSWNHLIVHLTVLNPAARTLDAIARATRLSRDEVKTSLQVLEKIGFVRMKGKEWEPGTAPRIHVGKRSPALRMLHLNTRVAAQRSLDRMDESDFHYSGALSIDRAAAEKIREILLAAVARMEAPVEEASDEEIHGIAIDFFQIRPFN